MSEAERLTVTLPPEIADSVLEAVRTGEYASPDDVFRVALEDWMLKRAHGLESLAALKADIAEGLADATAGRVADFDVARIVERGRASSTNH